MILYNISNLLSCYENWYKIIMADQTANKVLWQPWPITVWIAMTKTRLCREQEDHKPRWWQKGRGRSRLGLLFFPQIWLEADIVRYCAFRRTQSSAKSAADVILGRAFNNLHPKTCSNQRRQCCWVASQSFPSFHNQCNQSPELQQWVTFKVSLKVTASAPVGSCFRWLNE